MLKRYLKMIENSRVYEVASETPLVEATRLSLRLDNRVWMKREDLQPVYSFKLRGAYNKIASLSDEQRKRGVIEYRVNYHDRVFYTVDKEANLVIIEYAGPHPKY